MQLVCCARTATSGILSISWSDMAAAWIRTLTLIWTMSIATCTDIAHPEQPRTYCEDSTFEASCPDKSVIMMTYARYGRMQMGQCLTTEIGIGCFSDSMANFDGWCSGRRTCNVKVRDLVVSAAPRCLKDLRGYLEAAFTCIEVTETSLCGDGLQILPVTSSGYLASLTTQATGCGSIDAPWVLRAEPGQRINITLLDFSAALSDRWDPRLCQVVVVVKEVGSGPSKTVCRTNHRQSDVFSSTTHQVELRLMFKDKASSQSHFLLRYEIYGCKDLPVAKGTYFNRTPGGATITCEDGDALWRLQCSGREWVGEYYNCTDAGTGGATIYASKKLMSLPLGVSLGVVLAIALVIGTLVLVTGIVCFKRRRPQPPSRETNPPTVPSRKDDWYETNTQGWPTTHAHGTSHQDSTMYTSVGENTYFHTWELQRPPANQPQQVLVSAGTLPPYPQPPQDSYGRNQNNDHTEHIYESPKSLRRGTRNGSESVQYYELDPGDVDPGQKTMQHE